MDRGALREQAVPHNRVGGADRTVEEVFAQEKRWPVEMRALRSILRDTPLTEEGKGGQPCCTFEGSCVVILGGFKDNFVVSVLKGALLTDPQGVLQGPGEKRALGADDPVYRVGADRAHVAEAIAAEQAGLKAAFWAPIPGRQRSFYRRITAARQPATRAARGAACVPKILAGKGFLGR